MTKNTPTTTDLKDAEVCVQIRALYNTLSKKAQKNIHSLAGTYPFHQATKVWCIDDLFRCAEEKLRTGDNQWW